jgi:hypothetical protein
MWSENMVVRGRSHRSLGQHEPLIARLFAGMRVIIGAAFASVAILVDAMFAFQANGCVGHAALCIVLTGASASLVPCS